MTNYEKFLDEAKKKSRNVKPVSGPLIIPTVFSIHFSYWYGTELINKFDKITGRLWKFSQRIDKGSPEIYDADFSYVEVAVKGGRIV